MTPRGKLYGIGVGPGDPDLMTIRACRLLEASETIACPVTEAGGESTALRIVRGSVDLRDKEIVELVFTMNPDEDVRRKCRAEAADRVCGILSSGRDVAVPVLGDPSVYSTYMRIDAEIRRRGFDTEIVPGIPAMCSGAAAARIPLATGNEILSVVPMASKDIRRAERALDASDNVVFMKASGSVGDIMDLIVSKGIPTRNALVMSNVGMEDGYVGPPELDRRYGYFTTVLVKKTLRRCGKTAPAVRRAWTSDPECQNPRPRQSPTSRCPTASGRAFNNA